MNDFDAFHEGFLKENQESVIFERRAGPGLDTAFSVQAEIYLCGWRPFDWAAKKIEWSRERYTTKTVHGVYRSLDAPYPLVEYTYVVTLDPVTWGAGFSGDEPPYYATPSGDPDTLTATYARWDENESEYVEVTLSGKVEDSFWRAAMQDLLDEIDLDALCPAGSGAGTVWWQDEIDLGHSDAYTASFEVWVSATAAKTWDGTLLAVRTFVVSETLTCELTNDSHLQCIADRGEDSFYVTKGRLRLFRPTLSTSTRCQYTYTKSYIAEPYEVLTTDEECAIIASVDPPPVVTPPIPIPESPTSDRHWVRTEIEQWARRVLTEGDCPCKEP